MSYIENIFSLVGKNAIVTGAANGNGKEISRGLCHAGADVLLVDRDEEGLARSKSQIEKSEIPRKGKVYTLRCDITSSSDLELMDSFFSKVDILVNCAGITRGGSISQYTDKDWEDTLNVNLTASFKIIRMLSEKMPSGSSIINVTSLNSEMAFPENPAYVASKGGLKMLTKSAALDLGKRGVRVNSLGPGYVKTAMTAKSWSDENMRKQRSDKTILGRWGTPEDLVGAAIFLSSSASCYVTGQDIYVDGGWLAKGL